ncbi:hypothetical protein COOONC_22474 [Cooperia oncophora]
MATIHRKVIVDSDCLWEWTNDGSLLAYALSENGSDWMTVKFRSVDKEDLEGHYHRSENSALAWMKDKSGLFYSKFPDQATGFDGTSVDKNENQSLYFHRMGTDSKDDVLVYDRRDQSDLSMFAFLIHLFKGTVTEDGRFLIIYISQDSSNMLYYYDLSTMKGPIGKINPIPLFDKLDAHYQVLVLFFYDVKRCSMLHSALRKLSQQW